jgi:hypothetical protein
MAGALSFLMSTVIGLELLAGFFAACLSLWFVARRFTAFSALLSGLAAVLRPRLATYLLQPGRFGSLGLLLLRLTVGVMMIHHGQEKLADPQAFASTYVASLHLPFPLFFAYVAGLSLLWVLWPSVAPWLWPPISTSPRQGSTFMCWSWSLFTSVVPWPCCCLAPGSFQPIGFFFWP